MAKQRAEWLWLILTLFFSLFLILSFSTHKVFSLAVFLFPTILFVLKKKIMQIKDLFSSTRFFSPWELGNTEIPSENLCLTMLTGAAGLLTAQPIYQQCPDDWPQPQASHSLITLFPRTPKKWAKSGCDNSSHLLTSPFPMGAQPWYGCSVLLHGRGAGRGFSIPRRQGRFLPPQIA